MFLRTFFFGCAATAWTGPAGTVLFSFSFIHAPDTRLKQYFSSMPDSAFHFSQSLILIFFFGLYFSSFFPFPFLFPFPPFIFT